MKDKATRGSTPRSTPHTEDDGQPLVAQIADLRQDVSRHVGEMTLQLDAVRRRQGPTSREAVELAQALKGAIVESGPDDIHKLLRRGAEPRRRDAA